MPSPLRSCLCLLLPCFARQRQLPNLDLDRDPCPRTFRPACKPPLTHHGEEMLAMCIDEHSLIRKLTSRPALPFSFLPSTGSARLQVHALNMSALNYKTLKAIEELKDKLRRRSVRSPCHLVLVLLLARAGDRRFRVNAQLPGYQHATPALVHSHISPAFPSGFRS